MVAICKKFKSSWIMKKIKREGQYDVAKIERAIDSVFIDEYRLVKSKEGFYLERGDNGDFADFWCAILLLKDQAWFLDNVKTWLWYDSNDSSSPDDFAIEDLMIITNVKE